MSALDETIDAIGLAGRRLAAIGAASATAGNISMYVAGACELPSAFGPVERMALPAPAPELYPGCLVVTGSGQRLGEVADEPEASLGVLVLEEGGEAATLRTLPAHRFDRLTVELNSHLAVHRDQVAAHGCARHAVIHAQPLHLTYLSHIPAYQDALALNRRILRWEPESIYHLREGVGIVPFHVPASAELVAATVAAMQRHRVVVWAKHGVLARSEESVERACDLIECAEVGARFECLNLASGEHARGLSDEEIAAICMAFEVEQEIFRAR